jgi:hypothetical protein
LKLRWNHHYLKKSHLKNSKMIFFKDGIENKKREQGRQFRYIVFFI